MTFYLTGQSPVVARPWIAIVVVGEGICWRSNGTSGPLPFAMAVETAWMPFWLSGGLTESHFA